MLYYESEYDIEIKHAMNSAGIKELVQDNAPLLASNMPDHLLQTVVDGNIVWEDSSGFADFWIKACMLEIAERAFFK